MYFCCSVFGIWAQRRPRYRHRQLETTQTKNKNGVSSEKEIVSGLVSQHLREFTMDTAKALMVLWALAFGWCCEFPKEWQGQWLHSDLGEVIISSTNISKKGKCVESSGKEYLLENRESEYRCYTCLWLELKHRNILQYRESHCVGQDSLDNICDQIHMETVMHILIREPSEPSPCPFQGAFHFSYNNHSGGFCRNPSSYTKPCANQADYRFHFKQCSDAAYTHHRELDLQCLGSWEDPVDKEPPNQYLLGQLSDLHGRRRNYRCLMYEKQGTLMHLAVSADASCRGILSPRSGSLVLELTEDVFGWPSPACTLPAWMTKTPWRDLAYKHIYEPGEQGHILTLLHRRHPTDEPEVHEAYRCVRILQQNTTKEQFTFVSFSSHKCSSRYQCMRFVRRKDNVVEVHTGHYLEYETDPCREADMTDTTKRLLIPLHSQQKPCPIPGRYYIPTGSADCNGYLRSGCNGSDVIDIVSTCSSKPGLQLVCLKSWRENRRRYLVAKRLDGDGVANCFSFEKRGGDTMKFAIDDECNMDTPYILKDGSQYIIDAKEMECEYKKELNGVAAENQSRTKEQQNDDPSHGGTYTHVGESKQTRDERKAGNPSGTSAHARLCEHCVIVSLVLLVVSDYLTLRHGSR